MEETWDERGATQGARDQAMEASCWCHACCRCCQPPDPSERGSDRHRGPSWCAQGLAQWLVPIKQSMAQPWCSQHRQGDGTGDGERLGRRAGLQGGTGAVCWPCSPTPLAAGAATAPTLCPLGSPGITTNPPPGLPHLHVGPWRQDQLPGHASMGWGFAPLPSARLSSPGLYGQHRPAEAMNVTPLCWEHPRASPDFIPLTF